MRNYILIFIILTSFTLGCKAQTTIIALDDPNSYPNATKPLYRKDVNNIRDSFIGIWKGTIGNKELTIYLYPLNGVANGLYGPQGLQFQDGIMGYYIYKENGVVKINCKDELLNPIVPNDQRYGPIFGYTFDGEEMTEVSFTDYGITLQNPDGSYGPKGANADMVITNPNGSPLQMSFELENRLRGIVYYNPGVEPEPYNQNFSIPTNLVLTKISNTPPALE